MEKISSQKTSWFQRLESVNIASTWKVGKVEAIKILNENFEILKETRVTMLKQKKIIVGVNIDKERTEKDRDNRCECDAVDVSDQTN